jgi:hypothetical protein
MRPATLDRVLALLVVAMAGTGLLALKAGGPAGGWVFVLHDLVSGALLVAVIAKVRRSVPPAIRAGHIHAVALSLVLLLAITAALVGGFAWVASGRLLAVGPWTVLTLHAWLGLVVVPLVVLHLLPRRWRALRPPDRRGISRRTVLFGGGFAVASLVAFGLTSTLDLILGGVRRPTGSRWLTPGSIPPATTFYGEAGPAIDADTWRLRANGRVLDLSDLRALGDTEISAVLDCTSGWAVETTWRGVPLHAVIDVPDRGSIRIRSVTGWSTVLTPAEAQVALLATEVAGVPLPAENGAPCRLVVPGRRGLDWVKWVDEVTLA